MNLIEKKVLSDVEKIQISHIWNKEYPATLSFTEPAGFDSYLNTLTNPEHYILENETAEIKGWACKFTRDAEKWFAIILDGKIKGKGTGTEVLNTLKKGETKLNGWVIDKETYIKPSGEIYKSPLNFYIRNGFSICAEIRIENEKLSAVKITWVL